MINDVKEYFRYRIYENSRILVNDLIEVFEEIHMFIDNQITPYLKEHGGRIIIHDIELSFDEKLKWNIIESGEINTEKTKYIDFNNINEFITEDYINKVKERYMIYPKDLCGKVLLSFMETLNHFIYNDEKIDGEHNISDLCILSSNGNNNIVYEV